MRVLTLAVALTLSLSTAVADDWSRWLGPHQDGTTGDRDLIDGAPTLKLAWKKPLGNGYSAVAIRDGKALTSFGDGTADWLAAFDAKTGDELWRYRLDGETFPAFSGADGGPLSMPVSDGKRVFAIGARGQLAAVKLDDGTEVWRIDLTKSLGAKQPYFGFATVPLVDGDRLYVQAGGAEGRALVALDAKTGAVVWHTGDEKVGYQSPVLMELDGKRQLVAVDNTYARGHDPSDGAVLWQLEHGLASRDGHATAIALGDDRILLTGSSEAAAWKLAEADSKLVASELWRSNRLKGSFAMPVVHDGAVFGFGGNFLTAVGADDGEPLWKARVDASGVILVDGHLVVFDKDGDLRIGPASREGFEASATVDVGEENSFAYPTYADGAIFVRNLKSIARIDLGG